MLKIKKIFFVLVILIAVIFFGIMAYKDVYLTNQLLSPNLETRTDAAIKLALIWKKEEAVPVLLQSLIELEDISIEHNRKCGIALALLRFGQPAFGKLEKILKTDNCRYTRLVIIQTILDIAGQKEGYLIPLLMIALKDNVRYHASMASTALAKIGSPAVSHLINAILEKSLEESKFGFYYAFYSLAMIKLKPEEFNQILPLLFEKICNHNSQKRKIIFGFLIDTYGVNSTLIYNSKILSTLKEASNHSNDSLVYEIKAVLNLYGPNK